MVFVEGEIVALVVLFQGRLNWGYVVLQRGLAVFDQVRFVVYVTAAAVVRNCLGFFLA